MKHIAAIALGVGLFAGAAYADELPVTATFAKAVDMDHEVVIDSTVWKCSGNSCVTVSSPYQVRGVSGCRKMASKFGTVTAYGPADKLLSADELTRCNSSE